MKPCAGLKSATASPEDEENDSEGGAMVLAKRDKGQGEIFARTRAAGQIPQHILHLYDETAQSRPSPRDFRTNVINQLFIKSDSALHGGVQSLSTEVRQGRTRGDVALSHAWPLFSKQHPGQTFFFHAPSVKPSERVREKGKRQRKERLY